MILIKLAVLEIMLNGLSLSATVHHNLQFKILIQNEQNCLER